MNIYNAFITQVATLTVLAGCAVGPQDSSSSEQEAVKDFFEDYAQRSAEFDPSVAELYADSAILQGTQLMKDGSTKQVRMTGAQYKAMIPLINEQAKSLNDYSEYKDFEIEHIDEDEARILALRYSHYKCYEDHNYAMTVRKMEDQWRIVEEFQTMPEETQCEDASADDQLTVRLHTLASATNAHLPAMIDEDSRLEELTVTDHTLFYHYTLVNIASDDPEASTLVGILPDFLAEQSCSMDVMKDVLDQGAELAYRYTGSDGAFIEELRVNGEMC